MTLKAKYITFTALLHIALVYLTFIALKDKRAVFLASEVLVLLSFSISLWFVYLFFRPLRFIKSGINAIADKDFNVKFLPTDSETLNQLIDVYNKMIDNIRQERIYLQEQHFFLQSLIQVSPSGIIILDYDGHITDINPAAIQLLKLEDKAKQLTLENIPFLQEIAALKPNTSKVITGLGVEKLKCDVSQFIHRGFPRKFIMLQELSREFMETEKNAYGKVIRMMAHEVNNSIGAINSILNSTLDTAQIEDEDIAQSLKVAIGRNERLNQFMRNFADVIRLPAPQKEWLKLNELLLETARLLKSQADERQIKFFFDVPAFEVKLMGDKRQLEQALLNIIKNAMESIGQNGEVRFKLVHQPRIKLTIADNGAGISESDKKMLFTPFFSTKPTGQGIGLTIVREILTNHEATFFLHTSKSHWTEFVIYFN